MVLTVAVLLTVGSILFILMIRARDLPAIPPPSPTAHLEQRKAQIYENLRDLQFEFRFGRHQASSCRAFSHSSRVGATP